MCVFIHVVVSVIEPEWRLYNFYRFNAPQIKEQYIKSGKRGGYLIAASSSSPINIDEKIDKKKRRVGK